MNEDFSTEILKFALNPSANERVVRGRSWKHDAAKNSSRMLSNFLSLEWNGNADDCYQLKVHQKTDAKAQKMGYMGFAMRHVL